ncbi:MAG: hypothetical protein ABR968_07600 [Bacteroidales bacterium]|jgi:hypothetical protein
MKTKMNGISRWIVLAIIIKNLPLIVVLLAKKTWSTLTLCDDAQHIHTSANPLTNTPPVTDAALHSQATVTMNTYDAYKAVPPTATKSQVTTQRNILINMFNKVALYVQGVARDAAIAAGDVTAGMTVVSGVGFKIKKAAARVPKFFRVVSKIVGTVDITTKVVNAKAGYVRQYGTTPTKGVPPTTLSETIFSLESNVHIDNLKSGSIYGFREAIILPIKKIPVNPDSVIATGKTVKGTAIFTGHKAIFTEGVATHYVWSEWVYVVVM